MGWAAMIRKIVGENFQLLIGLAGIAFFAFMKWRQGKDATEKDRLRIELSLNKAKLKVAEIRNKEEKNSEKLKELETERTNIESKLQSLEEAKKKIDVTTSEDITEDDLSKEFGKDGYDS